MIPIHVLMENEAASPMFMSRHGLSIALSAGSRQLLLDVGPDSSFIENARRMEVDLSAIDFLLLSHAHHDHGGGIDGFCALNRHAPILLFGSRHTRCYSEGADGAKRDISFHCSDENRNRIEELTCDRRLDETVWFIRNDVTCYRRPTFNRYLYKQEGDALVPDDFDHEGILVVEDKGELAVLNSCSHTGVMNSLQCVRNHFPGRKIRSYVGGFHFTAPSLKLSEDRAVLDEFIRQVEKEETIFYTGHCTGEKALDYMQARMGTRIERIRSGKVIAI